VVVAALVVVAGVVVVTSGSGSSVSLNLGRGSLPPETVLDAYRLTYRVHQPGISDRSEDRTVRRPFDGNFVAKSGSTINSGAITNDRGSWVWLTQPSIGWASAGAGHHRSTADQWAGPALREAIKEKLAGVVGHRSVVGRPCTDVRAGGPMGSPLTPPTPKSHADLCIDDATGVVLREAWTLNGKEARTRTATAFDPSPTFTAADFDPTPAASLSPQDQANFGLTAPLDAKTVADLPYQLTPPPGFTLDSALSQTSGSPGSSTATTQLILHFVNGNQLLDLLQGPVSPDASPPKGKAFDLGPIGRGWLTLDLTASDLEVRTASGSYARLEGGDPDLLVKAAAGLRVKT
jgi:hypothetical protein